MGVWKSWVCDQERNLEFYIFCFWYHVNILVVFKSMNSGCEKLVMDFQVTKILFDFFSKSKIILIRLQSYTVTRSISVCIWAKFYHFTSKWYVCPMCVDL